jgi:hypothetical protein
MKTDKLSGLYSEFTPQERLNLAIAAVARNDQEERNKLFTACPHFKYKKADTAFSIKYDLMVIIGASLIIEWERIMGAIKVQCNIYDLLNKHAIVYEEIIQTLEKNPVNQKIILQLQGKLSNLELNLKETESAIDQQIIFVKTLLEAYQQFYQEIGIKNDIVLLWLKKLINLSDDLMECLEKISVDKEEIANLKRQLFLTWNYYS